MRKALDIMQQMHRVTFVYDSSLENIRPKGMPVQGNTLDDNLKAVFAGAGIRWEIRDGQVLLFRQRYYTYSGTVCAENGESLIHVTIFDRETGSGTLSNEHGFFSLTLPEGMHHIRFSYLGYGEVVKDIDLNANCKGTVYLKESSEQLHEVEVTGDLNAPLYTAQTGRVTLTADQLHTEFSLLSSSDLVKRLQSLPGVSSGTELLSGLYVHGGNNDENLFTLDGMPLYQINHVGGLFSAFNTDVVKNVDFYKSGFPARYGGRLSSVVDVRTKDGDMKAYHGNFSIGLLDGRIQLEGPLVEDRTSFNFGMRRSWSDLVTVPAFWLINRRHPDDKQNGRFAFHDINAKITHRLSDRNRLSLSVYSGKDLLKINSYQDDKVFNSRYKSDFKTQWGNLTTALTWNSQLSSKLSANVAGVYARSTSYYHYADMDSDMDSNGKVTSSTGMDRLNRTAIHDVGYQADFDYRPNMNHYIRFGSGYLYHLYRPDSRTAIDQSESGIIRSGSKSLYRGGELSLYAEDDVHLLRRMTANVGLRYTMYHTEGRNYHSVEPRLAVSYRALEHATLKLSYTEMSQYVHQLTNSYLNLPTDGWVPSTRTIAPMRSRQFAAGMYAELSRHLRLSVEGYYLVARNLLEFDGGNNLMLPADRWESLARTGRRKSYGIETSLAYRTRHTTMEAAYTLSWTRQRFPDFYYDWYPAKFDNRHKLNLTVRQRLGKHVDAYAAWTYHTGDRATLPTQYVIGPSLPDVPDTEAPELIYDCPNNVTLRAYHRLDVGFNFTRTTKRGHERIWNVSVYNAYCRTNAFYTRIERRQDGTFVGKGYGIIPILPSFSYTIKF